MSTFFALGWPARASRYCVADDMFHRRTCLALRPAKLDSSQITTNHHSGWRTTQPTHLLTKHFILSPRVSCLDRSQSVSEPRDLLEPALNAKSNVDLRVRWKTLLLSHSEKLAERAAMNGYSKSGGASTSIASRPPEAPSIYKQTELVGSPKKVQTRCLAGC